jgi:hypothetical protein
MTQGHRPKVEGKSKEELIMADRTSLVTSSALALVLCAAPAYAQTQKKEDPGTSGGATSGDSRAAQKDQKEKGAEAEQKKGTESKGGKETRQGESKDQPGKSTSQSEPQDKSKGTGQSESKDQRDKGTAQTEPKDQRDKGRAQTEPKDQRDKGRAQTEPKDQRDKGRAQTEPKDQRDKGRAQTEPKDQRDKGTAQTQPKEPGGKGTSVQLSDQQRTNVHSTILKEKNVNRATNVNFSVNVGTRVPRGSVRLAALPASVISVVPQYRSYQYFVANDQICIVDPNSYEIVEVISGPGRAAGTDTRGSGTARLVLTEEEKAIILREVEMGGGSTMGLGAISEGAEVPRDVQVRTFSETVVEKVPKVREYRYFTAENRVAIVDPQGSKVELLIESRR